VFTGKKYDHNIADVVFVNRSFEYLLCSRYGDSKIKFFKTGFAEVIEQFRMAMKVVTRDSSIGYESSNQYFYLPIDLVEAHISIRHAERWLEGL
jgi:hypothetical protein